MDETINHIILKYLENEANSSEKEILLKWLQESGSHLLYFEQTARSWEKVTMVLADREEADIHLQEIHRKIDVRKKVSLWYRIAGVVAVGILCYFSLKVFIPKDIPDFIIVVADNKKKQVLLPDSSIVWLNMNSILKYPEKFSKDRKVYLDGEGYFDVKKDISRTFIVSTNHFTVKVLGTQFLVTDKKNTPTGEVILEEGSIKLQAKDNPHNYLLTPNQLLRYNKNNKSVDVTSAVARNYTNWRNEQLIFVDTPLHEVFTQLGKWYNITIICKNKTVEKVPVSLTIDNETKEEVFHMLQLIAHFNYKINDGEIIIH